MGRPLEESQWYSALLCLHPGLCMMLQLTKAVSGLANSEVSLLLRTQQETARLPSALGVKLILCLGSLCHCFVLSQQSPISNVLQSLTEVQLSVPLFYVRFLYSRTEVTCSSKTV